MANRYTKYIPAPLGLDFNNFFVQGVPEYALELEGLVPRRRGLETLYDKVSVTLGGNGNTVVEAFASAGTSIWFAATGAPQAIYQLGSNVASYNLPVGSTMGSATDFATGAGSYTIFCNGADIPGILTIGGAWAASTFSGTGLTVNNLFQSVAYRGRLYFAEKNTQNFWYGAPNAINGTLTRYSLGGLLRKGGKIVAMTTLSSDSGIGPDDNLAIYTSSGEVVLFSGNDPGVSAWQVIGVYDIGPPPCLASAPQPKIFAKTGGDSLVLTSRGIFSLTELIKSRAPLSVLPISDKIGPLVTYWNSFGGGQNAKIHISTVEKLLILSINAKSQVYAMDLETGGWFSMSTAYGSAVSWLEISSGGVVQLYIIGFSSAAKAFSVTNLGSVNGAISPTLARFKSQYGRFGLADQFSALLARPYLYVGSLQAMTVSNMLAVTAGVAFDLRGNWNTRSLGANSFTTNTTWEQVTSPNLYGDFGLQNGNGFSRVFRPSFTLPSDPGNYMSLQLSVTPSTSNNCDVIKFLGTDVVIEAMPTSTI